MTTLAEAVAAAKDHAQLRCCACREAIWAAAAQDSPQDVGPHTCHGDLAVVCDVALAAGKEVRRRFACASSGVDLTWGFDVLNVVEAKIKRQFGLPEGSEDPPPAP